MPTIQKNMQNMTTPHDLPDQSAEEWRIARNKAYRWANQQGKDMTTTHDLPPLETVIGPTVNPLAFRELGIGAGKRKIECWEDAIYAYALAAIAPYKAEIERLLELIEDLDRHEGAEGWSEGMRERIDAALGEKP